MFTVEDLDLPITVAQKIITGTKDIQDGATKSLNKLFGGDGTRDMFTLEEIKEIADYLTTYYDSHKDNGD